MKKQMLFLLLCLGGSSFLFAQNLQSDLEQMMEQKLSSTDKGNINSFVLYAQKTPQELMDALYIYENSSVESIRLLVCDLDYLVYSYAKDKSLQNTALEKITAYLMDESKEVRFRAGSWLIQVNKQAFTEAALEQIRECFLQSYDSIDENMIKLSGYLNLNDVEGVLHDLSEDTVIDKKFQWNAYLALARMGDESSIEYILDQTELYEINDYTIQTQFPDLIYTRQHAIFDYLFSILNHPEKGCDSPNPEVEEKTICGYRIIEMLAPYIKNYPLKYDEDGLISKNYTKNLQTVRKWYEKNAHAYEIIADSF